MPAPSTSKRLRNTRISRFFLIGTQSWTLSPTSPPPPSVALPIPADHTKAWRVYIRPLHNHGPDINTWLKKVQFKLHHTYTDSTRTVESAPYETAETGYGEFDIEIRLYFDATSGEKAQYRVHRLRLEPFGSEAQMAAQRERNEVVAETCEVVEFNEPVVEFYEKMVGIDQFSWLPGSMEPGRKKGSVDGRGKGKGGRGGAKSVRGTIMSGSDGTKDATAELPAKSTQDCPWSQEMENQIMDMLLSAQMQLDIEIQKESLKSKDRQKRLQDISI